MSNIVGCFPTAGKYNSVYHFTITGTFRVPNAVMTLIIARVTPPTAATVVLVAMTSMQN